MNSEQIEKIEKHVELRNEGLMGFVDKVVTLCAGSLTLTITFRDSITTGITDHKFLLVIAWIGFSIAVLFGTMLHLAKFIVHSKLAAAFHRGERTALVNAGWFFPVFFIVMTLGFIIGIATLCTYAIFNLY